MNTKRRTEENWFQLSLWSKKKAAPTPKIISWALGCPGLNAQIDLYLMRCPDHFLFAKHLLRCLEVFVEMGATPFCFQGVYCSDMSKSDRAATAEKLTWLREAWWCQEREMYPRVLWVSTGWWVLKSTLGEYTLNCAIGTFLVSFSAFALNDLPFPTVHSFCGTEYKKFFFERQLLEHFQVGV